MASREELAQAMLAQQDNGAGQRIDWGGLGPNGPEEGGQRIDWGGLGPNGPEEGGRRIDYGGLGPNGPFDVPRGPDQGTPSGPTGDRPNETWNGMDANGTLWQNGMAIGVTPGRDNSRVWYGMDPSINAPMTDLAQSGAFGNPAAYDTVANSYGAGTGQVSPGMTVAQGGPFGSGMQAGQFPGYNVPASAAQPEAHSPTSSFNAGAGFVGGSPMGGPGGIPGAPGGFNTYGIPDSAQPSPNEANPSGWNSGGTMAIGVPGFNSSQPGLPSGSFDKSLAEQAGLADIGKNSYASNTFADRFADFGRATPASPNSPDYDPGAMDTGGLVAGIMDQVTGSRSDLNAMGGRGGRGGFAGAGGRGGFAGATAGATTGFPGGGSYGDFAATSPGYGGGAFGGAGSFGGFGGFGGFTGGGWGGFDPGQGGYSGGYDTAAGAPG